MNKTIKERLTAIETSLNNHLKHHEIWTIRFLIPILVLVIGTVVLGVLNMVF